MISSRKARIHAMLFVALSFGGVAKAEQFYVGFSYLANYAEIDVQHINQQRVEENLEPVSIRSHGAARPVMTFGYQVLPQVGLQVSYAHDIRFSNDPNCFLICGLDPDLSYEMNVKQVDLSARFEQPFGRGRWYGFAIAGASLIEERLYSEQFADAQQTLIISSTEKQKESTWHAGIGIEWRFSKLVGLQLSHQYTDFHDLRLSALTWKARF
ncbi:outer membrane beta-barrel protein [Permianibacter aggregans]|uniref:Outer membrane protein with beta-barrel domain n=1 Tax=Permianibacter aggregans TaxID=1510150 RepID=A0A4R6UT13_9GAMM|nr:outer membrane beta-barrel protein [Permianibacter aggregans]QGX40454.1 hypothetical protein E2H98_12560 [Permianibacter aggregans]TDQ49406.1 outer membrane protein with beta-barrel domain [Permianibacter aggregans]